MIGLAWNEKGNTDANNRISPNRINIVNACDPSKILEVKQFIALQQAIQIKNMRQTKIPKHDVVSDTTSHNSLVRNRFPLEGYIFGIILTHLHG